MCKHIWDDLPTILQINGYDGDLCLVNVRENFQTNIASCPWRYLHHHGSIFELHKNKLTLFFGRKTWPNITSLCFTFLPAKFHNNPISSLVFVTSKSEQYRGSPCVGWWQQYTFCNWAASREMVPNTARPRFLEICNLRFEVGFFLVLTSCQKKKKTPESCSWCLFAWVGWYRTLCISTSMQSFWLQ